MLEEETEIYFPAKFQFVSMNQFAFIAIFKWINYKSIAKNY